MLSPALLLGLAACPAPGDGEAPLARVDFPLPAALTDAPTIRVRGTASDASGVAVVRVDGVPASTADGFAHWWAEVPLELGENLLVVETVDVAGNLDPAAAATVVRRDGAIVRRPQGLALDPASETCFVFDWVPEGGYLPPRTRFLRADLATGEVHVISSRSKGAGPLPRYATGEMEYDAAGGRLLALDLSAGRLLAVDVASGDRTVVSGDGVGTGPAFQNAGGLELDLANASAWVVNRSFGPTSGAVLQVDLVSGDRTVVSGPGVGSGPWPQFQTWMTRDASSGRLLIACYLDDLVLSVDPLSGARAIVSDASQGLGVPWHSVWDVAALPGGRAWVASPTDGRLFGLDPVGGVHAEVAPPAPGEPRELFDLELDLPHGRLLASDDLRAAVLAMDLDGGALGVLLRNSLGGGAPFRRTMAVGTAVDRRGRVWTVDHEFGELVAIDPATGARTLVSGGGAGNGPAFVQPARLGIDASGASERVIVLDLGLEAFLAVDPASGARTLVSGAGVGSGPPLNLPTWTTLSIDVAGGAAWILDGAAPFSPESRLLRVDLASGARTIVSGDGVGNGPTLVECVGVALDLAGGRALAFSFDELLAIDLASGDRSVLSSDAIGSGPSFGDPVLLEWDEAEGRALVYGRMAGLTAVDGASGDRERLAEADELAGPGLAWPLSMDLWRAEPGGEPLLFVGDHELTALTVFDLAREPVTGGVPAARTIVAR